MNLWACFTAINLNCSITKNYVYLLKNFPAWCIREYRIALRVKKKKNNFGMFNFVTLSVLTGEHGFSTENNWKLI